MKIVRLLFAFLLACIITILLASVLQTQMVIAQLSNLNIAVPMNDRLYMIGQDILGLFPTYGVVIVLGLAIGFGLTKVLIHFTPATSAYWYTIAGGTTMWVILLAMQPVLGVTLLAGARSILGMGLQILAGFVGGYCFVQLRKSALSTT